MSAATTRLHAVQELSDGGRLVHLRQHVGGVEVYGGDLKVLLDADGALRSIAGTPASARSRATGS